MSRSGTIPGKQAGQRADGRAARPRAPAPGWLLAIAAAAAAPRAAQQAAGQDWQPFVLVTGCLLLSNAGSLLLPGSNLTNLIVLGHLHLSGALFLSRMWPAWLAALAVTAGVIAVAERRELHLTPSTPAAVRPVRRYSASAWPRCSPRPCSSWPRGHPPSRSSRWARSPSPRAAGRAGSPGAMSPRSSACPCWPGCSASPWRSACSAGYGKARRCTLTHLGAWATAGVAAMAAVLVNNLPAASLLAARTPGHPFALLIGLNLGPNLLASGSLAWILWLKSARTAGADPSLRRASRLGAVAVPLAMTAALAGLMLTGGAG